MNDQLVITDSQLIDTGGNVSFTDGGVYTHLAQKILATDSYYVTKVALSLNKVGSPGGTIQAHIRIDTGALPGASITNGDSNTVDPLTLGTSQGLIDFNFAIPPSLVNGTAYHIELTHSGATFNGGNTVGWWVSGSNNYPNGILEYQISSGGWLLDPTADLAWGLYRMAAAGGFI